MTAYIPTLQGLPIPETQTACQPVHLTGANLISNFPWGNFITLPKPQNVFCIYGLDPNGFCLDKEGSNATKFFTMASSIEASFAGCAECNLDFTQFCIQDLAYNAIQHIVEHSKAVWSTTLTKFEQMYKPGEMMSCILGNAVARVKEVGSNNLSCWSYVKLLGKDHCMVTFITVYQVCKKQNMMLDKDKCTVHSKQHSLLVQQNKQDPSPIKNFQKDLDAFLNSSHAEDEKIVLFGDLNKVLGSDSSSVLKLA
jgi:hypothetical protein